MEQGRSVEPDATSVGANKRALFRPQAAAEPDPELFSFSAPSWRRVSGVFAFGAALLLVFALFANFDRVAVARGIIIPAAGVSRLTAPRSGFVDAIFVRQGASVHRGSPLLSIRSAGVLAGGRAAADEEADSFQREQQLAMDQGLAEQQRLDGERAELEERQRQIEATLGFTRTQIALQRQRIEKNEQRLASMGPLRLKGYVSELSYRSLEEAILSLRQQLATFSGNATDAEHELARLRLQIAEERAQVRQAQLQLAARQQGLSRNVWNAREAAAVTLVAPFNGLVAALPVSSGQTVTSGQELMALVPKSSALDAELFVPASSAGSLGRGQTVLLRFDAYPYQQYGTGRGVIRDVPLAASFVAGNSQPFYRTRVRITRGIPGAMLKADMGLAASIVLERRSILGWLVAPLLSALRERGTGAGS
jgi:membrane fusion protein